MFCAKSGFSSALSLIRVKSVFFLNATAFRIIRCYTLCRILRVGKCNSIVFQDGSRRETVLSLHALYMGPDLSSRCKTIHRAGLLTVSPPSLGVQRYTAFKRSCAIEVCMVGRSRVSIKNIKKIRSGRPEASGLQNSPPPPRGGCDYHNSQFREITHTGPWAWAWMRLVHSILSPVPCDHCSTSVPGNHNLRRG